MTALKHSTNLATVKNRTKTNIGSLLKMKKTGSFKNSPTLSDSTIKTNYTKTEPLL